MQFEIVKGTGRAITSGDYVNFPTLTQTQINALTGMALNSVVFNSTTSRLQIWNGGSWESFTVGAVTTPSVTTVSVDTTLDYGTIYQGDATSNSLIFTLPTAIGSSGEEISINKTDATGNTITVITVGGQTINGEANLIIRHQNTFITLISNGSNFILS